MHEWILHFDGLCEPKNPGGWLVWAWLLEGDGETNHGWSHRVPAPGNTNNDAEWFALGTGLRAVTEIVTKGTMPPDKLVILGDSQLVVNQLNGLWQCRKPLHATCRQKCVELLGTIGVVAWVAQWIPREKNETADRICRELYRQLTGRTATYRVRGKR